MATNYMLGPIKIFDAAEMSGTNTIESKVVDIRSMTLCSLEADWSGSSVLGTFSIQGSLSYSKNPDGSVRDAGVWNDIGKSIDGPNGSDTGSDLIDLGPISYPYLRLEYSNTSGTGALTAYVCAKGI